nr:DNA-directed RNA polymerase I subunit RPA1 isoform X2 [Parasteatoda tepidariorum]
MSIQAKLHVKYDDAIKDADSVDANLYVKSVVECRRNIVKSFVKQHMMGAKGNCPYCKQPQRKITRNNNRFVFTDSGKRPGIGGTRGANEYLTKEFTAEEARKHLLLLWKNDKIFLKHIYKLLDVPESYSGVPIDMFFMTVIIVPPSKFRRLNVMHGRKYADVQTLAFCEVLKDCILINKLLQLIKGEVLDENEKEMVSKIPGKSNPEKFSNAYFQLQSHINEIYDSEVNKKKGATTKGVKQILEKKEGLFRMNMMGKRVNYACRSVISPDPYIMVNEIGVPLVFAKKLTFPEPVSILNFERLQRAVKNGPNVHPGATLVQYENGRVVRLTDNEPIKRHAIANTLLTPPANPVLGGVKIVHRHLRNGDMLLLNRQPTLHKPSIMAHKARVLPGEKTLRLHYSNCKSYNADFDGDEMNAHLPQSLLGQSEARHMVGVNHQYLVPKDGTPLGGLIQDHIIAGVLITMRGRFFCKEDYHELLYSAMSFNKKRLKLLPPTILKPQVLWSGKQIVSSIIINLIPEGKTPLSVEGKAKVSSKNWKTTASREWLAGGTPLTGDAMSESEVIIRKGELLCGVIDKAQVGPTPYSLIHICYELYGGETSSVLLTALARLFTHYLQYFNGFSLGIEDIVVEDKANKKRRRIFRKANANGRIACAQALDLEDKENIDDNELLRKFKETHFSRDDFGLKMLDMEMKKVTHDLNNQINEVCLPSGLKKKFPENNLQLMIESGAKGSSVNAMQISCLLGQIELEGRRMPLMLNGSTLPSFLPYSTSPSAGGFVAGRFLTGINIQEYFFHCMAGREGLIDTAVKTSRSGYLQRCLIKHLEGITVNYDLTVRDSDGTVVQFLYGEDGLDPLKMQLLKEKSFNLLLKNYDTAMNEREVQALKNLVKVDLEKEKKKITKWKKKHPGTTNSRLSILHNISNDFKAPKDRIRDIISSIENIEEGVKNKYERRRKKCPDPINDRYRPDVTIGSVTERMDSLIDEYIKKNSHGLLRNDGRGTTKEKFKDLCYYRSLRALADPGEAVGLLAAQSIGEPSTQMTLNTFHFAGKGEMNVTLGIPRMREILMTASPNIATPTMDLPLLDKPGIEKAAEKLKVKLSPVPLKDVLESVKIKEQISISKTMMSFRNYYIKIKFLKYSDYKGLINTNPNKNLKYIEKTFIKKLLEAIKKKMKQSATSKVVDAMKEGRSFIKSEPQGEGDDDNPPPSQMESSAPDEGESSAESEDEGDTTSSKTKMRHNQEQEYEDPEDEEMLPESDEEENETGAVKIKQEILSDEEEEGEKLEEESVPGRSENLNTSTFNEDHAQRINFVKCLHSYVFDYEFDTEFERWCKITLQLQLEGSKIDMKSVFEEEVSKAYVYAIPNIKEAILVKNPDAKDGGPKLMLKTSGVNFLEIFKHVDVLDINKIYSNNIHAIADIYGIEAASKVIHKEIVNVFATYGITVDPRHLSLVADYMTSSGKYRPCNRVGMEGNASPLLQMSFETTTNFMVDAMLNGVQDRLQSPSATISLGQLFKAGTGAFDLKIKYKCEK